MDNKEIKIGDIIKTKEGILLGVIASIKWQMSITGLSITYEVFNDRNIKEMEKRRYVNENQMSRMS